MIKMKFERNDSSFKLYHFCLFFSLQENIFFQTYASSEVLFYKANKTHKKSSIRNIHDIAENF